MTAPSPTSWRTIFALALPVALQSLLQALLGMADIAMVTGLGTQSVAAVGLAAKLHFLLLVLMFGVASAGGVMVAQYHGAKDLPGAQQAVSMTLLLGALITTPFTLLFALSQYWLHWINPDPQVVELASQYLVITALVVFTTQAFVILEVALRSRGETIPPLLIGATAVFLNIFLNWLLIFGHWGFPPMGVAGAAWATLISRAIQLLIYVIWMFLKKHPLSIHRLWLESVLSLKEIKRFFRFASPLVINHGVWALGNASYHVATGFSGTEALAILGIMVPIESIFFALFIGLASASAVLVGQALGGNKNSLAISLSKQFERLTLGLVLVFSLALWLSRPLILDQFQEMEPASLNLLLQALSVFCAVTWIRMLNMVRILGVLRAGGDNTFCLITDFIVMWIAGIPIFILAVWLGAPFFVIYALISLEDLLKFLPVRFRIKKQIWLKNLTVR